MMYIFVDTNIFLHFQNFENIDWLSESNSEECCLVIAPIVIDELDEKKIGTNKIANRARNILNRFEELDSSDSCNIDEKVRLELLIDKPSKDIYEQNNLNFDEKDHRLLASIIQFKNHNNTSKILICSNDIGPRIRAKRFDINSLKLDPKYQIPDTLSDEEKKIKHLEKENQAFRKRKSKIEIKHSCY